MDDIDVALLDAAFRLIREIGDKENHTVSAAVRTTDGEIVTGVNLAHFTGGPCAEVVALANVARPGRPHRPSWRSVPTTYWHRAAGAARS